MKAYRRTRIDFAGENPRHRRRRLHRLQLRAPHARGRLPRPRGRRRRRLRRAHLLRQPREPRAGRRLAALLVRPRRHPRPRTCSTRCCPASTPSCTSRPSRTSTGRCVDSGTVRRDQRASAPSGCSTRACAPASSASCTSAPTRSTARSPRARGTRTRPLEPNSPYSASKAGSDLLARSYHRTHGMNLSITRCSNNYGPYHFPEKVIPLFVTNLIDDQHVPLYGDGREHPRLAARRRPHPRHRAGRHRRPGRRDLQHRRRHRADQPRAHPAAARRDRAATGRTSTRVEDRKGHDLRYSVDISKIRGELGYEPLVPFEQGLADVVQWYRDNRDWWEPLKARAALT